LSQVTISRVHELLSTTKRRKALSGRKVPYVDGKRTQLEATQLPLAVYLGVKIQNNFTLYGLVVLVNKRLF
jgi:hypothetical protein